MYRSKSLEEISGMITIYKTNTNKQNITIESDNLTKFLSNPTLPRLIKILKNDNILLKKAVLTSLNCNINYSSISPYLNNDIILFNLLKDINLDPIYTEIEIKAIMKYIKTKSNTSIIAKQQTEDVRKFFETSNFKATFSSCGATDIDFKGRKAAAKSDGIIYIDDMEIITYLRYGSSSGGSQNDRWRSMFSTASRHQDKLFLFIVDGAEALQQYDLCKEEFNKDKYPNAIWSTVKYLNFINFDDLKFVKF
jgi:hypothetical protein